MRKSRLTLAFGVTVLLALTGCKPPQDVAYFQDTDAVSAIMLAPEKTITVRPEDKLNIVVKTKDPEISEVFNLPIYGSRVGTVTPLNGTAEVRNYYAGGTDGIATYTVSPQGTIDFPVLGVLKVAGMTRSELAGFIKGEIMGRQLAKDPQVTVEFVNTGINVLGEVEKPGRYDFNKDRISILEGLALAEDIKIDGKRTDVKVFREEDGQMKVYTLDITNAEKTMQSPGYWLQQGDVIVVSPNDRRKRETTVNGNNALSTSFWISVASLITTAVTTVGVFIKK